jgi:DNA-binding response OmpR family regulator
MIEAKSLALVASPDAITALLFETVLDAHGFETVLVADGFEAADVALTRRPSLVVLDRLITGLDAFSVCRLLKSRRATDHIPLIVTTPYDTRAERDAALEAGADQVLVEPCAPELLALEARRLVVRMAEARAAERVAGYTRRATDARPVAHRTGSR